MSNAEPFRRVAASACAALAVAGCSLAPTYTRPPTSTPVAYKETGPWTPASPADAAPRGDWWAIYGDATLNSLEQKIETGNPELAYYLSRYDESRAYLAQARAAQLPEVDGTGMQTTDRQSDNRYDNYYGRFSPYYQISEIGYGTSYELDLWGRIRNMVTQNKALAQAGKADLANMRLSLQATLADAYMTLRGLDAQTKLLADTTEAYAKALKLIQDQHDGGEVAGLDVDRAETQLRTARAQLVDVTAQRALYEHAIASLIGENASTFSLAPVTKLPTTPQIPVSAPSDLLQRRPDIAAAERRTAAANANIGVARAARYPTITLNAGEGLMDAGGVSLLKAGNAVWALGPTVTVPFFDEGRRKAAVRAARDQFNEASASYRSIVLTAFQQVEDNLTLNNKLADEAREQAAAVDSARKTEDLAMTQYQLGAVTYLDVIIAQTADLQAQSTEISIATRRLQASVDLIRAMGGGWSPHDPARPKAAAVAAHAG
jgi:NodT family efflux transporter outer membrane factor (OMF) lipoprotein